MKTYLCKTLEYLKTDDIQTNVQSILCNKSWWVFNNAGEKEVYIFNTDNTLIISVSGKVTNGTWQYIPANNSIIINGDCQSYMVHPTFYDKIILALKVDGTKDYAFLIDERHLTQIPARSLTDLTNYFIEREKQIRREKELIVLAAIEEKKRKEQEEQKARELEEKRRQAELEAQRKYQVELARQLAEEEKRKERARIALDISLRKQEMNKQKLFAKFKANHHVLYYIYKNLRVFFLIWTILMLFPSAYIYWFVCVDVLPPGSPDLVGWIIWGAITFTFGGVYLFLIVMFCLTKPIEYLLEIIQHSIEQKYLDGYSLD